MRKLIGVFKLTIAILVGVVVGLSAACIHTRLELHDCQAQVANQTHLATQYKDLLNQSYILQPIDDSLFIYAAREGAMASMAFDYTMGIRLKDFLYKDTTFHKPKLNDDD